MGERSFTFPDVPEIKVRIIRAVPTFWESVRGSLLPPPEQRSAHREKIDFHFENQSQPATTLRLDLSENKPEHVQRITFNGPPPFGSIEFVNESALYKQLVMESCKALATILVLKGYGGVLNFSKDQVSPADFSTAARCSMTFDFERARKPGGPIEPGIVSVRLTWDEQMGGTETDLKPILDECQAYQGAPAPKT